MNPTESAISEIRITGDKAGAQRARIALVCDFREENWPSMDLVAEMLETQLVANHSSQFSIASLRPSMTARFTRLPGFANWSLSRNGDRLFNRFVDYPRRLRPRAGDFDLFHVLDHSYAQLVHELPSERTIVTCHDLDAFRCLLDPQSEPRPRWFRSLAQRILAGMQRAAHIITGSNAVRDQLLESAIVPENRITVIPNGVHPSCTPEPDLAADAEAARLLPRDDAGTFWLLNVGSTIRRKRLDVMLRVLAAVRHDFPQVRLARVGGPWTRQQAELVRELALERVITVLPPLDRGVLAAVYRRADLLVQTSEAEGFGLPLIEAQACGCPVIATDLKVLREIGGTAADYVPVADIAAWTESLAALLVERTTQGSEWKRRRDRGRRNASRFCWSQTAARTADLYKTVVERADCQASSN